jgi:hypothetical protein
MFYFIDYFFDFFSNSIEASLPKKVTVINILKCAIDEKKIIWHLRCWRFLVDWVWP